MHLVTGSDGSQFCVPDVLPKGCPQALNANGSDPACRSFPITPKRAIDPNDKVGTLGASDPGFVAAAVPLNYVVHYENLATATAPAQVVVVSDPLDASKMDLSTFELGPISFGNITVVPNAGSKTFTGGADLRPEQDVIVAIKATLDPSTGMATWVFTSIDPYTGQLTDDPNAGFLPPNVNSPAGEGSVVFSVMPRNGLATGTAIKNRAQIVFDTNAPIATPTWLNTIDKDAPTSHISALPATVSTPSFSVQWSGTDAGSGVQDYTIYVSDNGGPFTASQTNVISTSAAFAGVVGHTYGFYSVARDLVGNVESKPQVAEASTQIGVGQSPPTALSYQLLFGSQSVTMPGGRTNLPWTAITGVKVTFSKPVTANCSSLAGVSVTGCSGSGTNTLTWTFGPLARATYITKVLGTTANAVVDLAGNPLGGGVDFAQALNVLPGDVSDDGNVASNDLVLVNNARALPYNVIYDVNGDGVVDINDVNLVRARIGAHLP